MKLKKISTLAMVCSLLVTTIASSEVYALNSSLINQNNISKNSDTEIMSINKEEVIKWFKDNGLDQDTIDSLIKKLDSGKLIDAINPSMKSRGIVTYSDNYKTKIIYPDGSITITGIEGGEIINIPKTKASITGGTSSTGSGYTIRKGAKVYHNSGVLNMSFYATYTNVQGGYDKIDSVYDKKCTSYLGTWSYISFGRQKIFEDANGPARARFEVIYNASAGSSTASGNFYLDLRVGGDTATAVFK